jgi:hypothetical protein
MGKRPLLSALCVGCAVLLSTSSWATTVELSEGTLMINKGKGFKAVKHQVVAKAGDSIMVSPGGHAKLVYPDGCTIEVQPGAVTTVTRLSPCASGSYAQNQDYGNHWCVTPANPIDNNNPGYCAGVPVTAAVLAVFGTIIYEAVSP